jgi:hypothetical protein
MARTDAATTDYGAPVGRTNKLFRPLLAATHALHLISSIIVMSIAAYFIANFNHNTHLVYWISIVRSLIFAPCHTPKLVPTLPLLLKY